MWGPPKDIMMMQQEIGRCARDGLPGKAILYVTPRSTSSKFVDEDVKIAVTKMKTNCIRKTLLDFFYLNGMTKLNAPVEQGSCCSTCDLLKSPASHFSLF
jgi:superfamily II DNA helicase RecQ